MPYLLSYLEIVKLAGVTPDQLRATITLKTKLFLLNSPSDPTGAVYTPNEIWLYRSTRIHRKKGRCHSEQQLQQPNFICTKRWGRRLDRADDSPGSLDGSIFRKGGLRVRQTYSHAGMTSYKSQGAFYLFSTKLV